MNQQTLSQRELEILMLVCRELSCNEIGEQLNISTATVYTHRRNILAKTGSKNKIGMVKYALKHGLLK